MYKVICNNLIIDVMEKPRYVRFLQKSQRTVETDRLAATGVMASNGEEVYHLEGKENLFPNASKTVRLEKIDKKEFDKLKSEMTRQLPVDELKGQVDALAAMVSQLSAQNETLLQQIEEINRGEG